jgi:hypothetical protein
MQTVKKMADGSVPAIRPPWFMRIMQGHGMPVRDMQVRDMQVRGTTGHGMMGHDSRRRTDFSSRLS